MEKQKEVEIKLNKQPTFSEVWFEGSVLYEGEEHKFWLVDPQSKDKNEQEFECEVKWFFKSVPREVRASYASIIEMYKNIHYKTDKDDSTDSARDSESV